MKGPSRSDECAARRHWVDFDAAVIDEAGQRLPARRRVADRLGELGLLADQGKLCAQPWLRSSIDRTSSSPSDGAPLLGAAAADVLLDRVEPPDAFERLAGDRRRAGGGELIKPSAHMRPAESEFDVAALGEDAIAGVAIDLENAFEAGEMGDRPLRLAIGRIEVDDAGRIGAAPRSIVAGIGPKCPVFVRPRPGSSTGAVVSSAKSLAELLSIAKSRSCTGLKRKAARPTQSAKVERSRLIAWRA